MWLAKGFTLNVKCLQCSPVFVHLVPRWWCCLGEVLELLGSGTSLEGSHLGGGFEDFYSLLSSLCFLVMDVNVKINSFSLNLLLSNILSQQQKKKLNDHECVRTEICISRAHIKLGCNRVYQ